MTRNRRGPAAARRDLAAREVGALVLRLTVGGYLVVHGASARAGGTEGTAKTASSSPIRCTPFRQSRGSQVSGDTEYTAPEFGGDMSSTSSVSRPPSDRTPGGGPLVRFRPWRLTN
jgi:hypothetical protein